MSGRKDGASILGIGCSLIAFVLLNAQTLRSGAKALLVLLPSFGLPPSFACRQAGWDCTEQIKLKANGQGQVGGYAYTWW